MWGAGPQVDVSTNGPCIALRSCPGVYYILMKVELPFIDTAAKASAATASGWTIDTEFGTAGRWGGEQVNSASDLEDASWYVSGVSHYNQGNYYMDNKFLQFYDSGGPTGYIQKVA